MPHMTRTTSGANSHEFDEATAHPVVSLMADQKQVSAKGGTMRLGAYACTLKPGSLASRIYGKSEISERHRHRYEMNNAYRQQFEEKGLRNASSVDEVDLGTLFVRAHGLPVEVFDKAGAKGLNIVDATCPMVTKIHVQAEKLRADGYKIIVVGDPNHPEVKGTMSHVPGAWIVQAPEDVDALPRASRVCVVVQSTWSGGGLSLIHITEPTTFLSSLDGVYCVKTKRGRSFRLTWNAHD